jgi:hypothetical protein
MRRLLLVALLISGTAFAVAPHGWRRFARVRTSSGIFPLFSFLPNGPSAADVMGGYMPPSTIGGNITFARTSAATCRGADAGLYYIDAGVPCVEPLGLWLEATATTNHVLASQQLTDLAVGTWAAFGAGLTWGQNACSSRTGNLVAMDTFTSAVATDSVGQLVDHGSTTNVTISAQLSRTDAGIVGAGVRTIEVRADLTGGGWPPQATISSCTCGFVYPDTGNCSTEKFVTDYFCAAHYEVSFQPKRVYLTLRYASAVLATQMNFFPGNSGQANTAHNDGGTACWGAVQVEPASLPSSYVWPDNYDAITVANRSTKYTRAATVATAVNPLTGGSYTIGAKFIPWYNSSIEIPFTYTGPTTTPRDAGFLSFGAHGDAGSYGLYLSNSGGNALLNHFVYDMDGGRNVIAGAPGQEWYGYSLQGRNLSGLYSVRSSGTQKAADAGVAISLQPPTFVIGSAGGVAGVGWYKAICIDTGNGACP